MDSLMNGSRAHSDDQLNGSRTHPETQMSSSRAHPETPLNGSRAHVDKVPGRREESVPRLKRTESRGRKRSDHPNRSPGSGAENVDPNTKRQSVDGSMPPPTATTTATGGDKFQRSNKLKGGREPAEESGPENNSNKQHSLHLSRERSLKSISNWWKNSLEAGPTPPDTSSQPASPEWTTTSSPKHNHSHSDSGISSLSGRSSCMSPMSDLSSSSSGSSRTSLRSSSIVSASNIPLEEEVELEYEELCRDLLVYSPPDSRINSAISKFT